MTQTSMPTHDGPTQHGRTDRPSGTPAASRGFRPTARRRNRLAAGLALGAAAIGANVLVYASLNSSEPVVQVVRDVPAGEQITADMLRTVDADVDSTVNTIGGADMQSLIGQYAKVRLVAGSLVVYPAIQSQPLLSAGNAVVAIEVKAAELPVGLRERVPVLLVIPPIAGDDSGLPTTIDGRVVGLPVASESGLGTQSVSIEVEASLVASVAAADEVRIVLLVPSTDPAVQDAGE